MFNYPATLEADDALRFLELAVEDKGYDYRMDSECLYVTEELGTFTPRCLVGVALHKAGVNVGAVLGGHLTNGCRIGAGTDDRPSQAVVALREAGVALSDETLTLFTEAQDAQDLGRTWGEALCIATRTRLSQVRPKVNAYEPPF